MIVSLIALAVLTFLFWLEFRITGELLSAEIGLFIKLPYASILRCLVVETIVCFNLFQPIVISILTNTIYSGIISS